MSLPRTILLSAVALLASQAVWAARAPGGGGGSGGGFAAPAQSDFERAEDLIKAGSYEDAIPILQGIIRDNPNEADSLYYMGFVSEKMLNHKTAFSYYARAVKADPDHKRAREGLGLLYLTVGDLAGATVQLDELKRICAVLCDERQRLAAGIAEFKAHGTAGGAKGKTSPDDMDDLTTLP